MLRNASEVGFGGKQAFSRPARSTDGSFCLPKTTIDQTLAKRDIQRYNEVAAERIQANIDILKRETGITDDEIILLPAVFYAPSLSFPYCTLSSTSRINSVAQNDKLAPLNILEAGGGREGGRLQGRQHFDADPVVAYYPGVVNGVVMSDSYVLVPNPWGPVIDGQDIFAVQVVESYSKVNYNVTLMDDYFSHHILDGEIHCGCNTWRDTRAPWW